MKITAKTVPPIDPSILFLGLILGRIFFSPNFVPKKKAAVSHSQTDKNNKSVTLESKI